MGVRENKVERYLDEQVRMELDGETRKWVSPGVIGVPDRIVFAPLGVHFVEVKTTDGVLEPYQIREAGRLREAGAIVTCVYGEKGVDGYINDQKMSQPVKREYR